MTRLKKLVEKTIEYSFYALFAITPLLFNPIRQFPSFELFEWNKMVFVYFLTLLICTLWLIRMVFVRRVLFRRTPFDIPLLLLLLSQVLSTLFSIDRHVSLFGYYSRFHGGLLSTISYILLYFAFVSNATLISKRKLLSYILFTSTFVAGYGVLEKFGIDAHMWVQDVRNRVFSTLGQPNWLAAYLAIVLPISIYHGMQIYKNNSVADNDQNFKPKASTIIHFSLITLLYVCLLFTKSRSGFLGFWVANALFWMFTFYVSRQQRLNSQPSVHRFVRSTLSVFIVLNSLFLISNFFIRTPFPQYNQFLTIDIFGNKSQPVESAPVGDTVINVGVTDSSDIRRIVWKGAVRIAHDYPLFGTGPETFAYAYYKYRSPEHNLTSEWDFLYNRAHNEFLNILATSGYFGLGMYLLFIITVIGWSIKSIFETRTQHTNNSHTQNLLAALFAAYVSILITNFFGFSVVTVGIYFFLIPALMIHIRQNNYRLETDFERSQNLPDTEKVHFQLSGKQKMLLLIIGTGSLYILSFLIRYWFADSLYAKALSHRRQDLLDAGHEYIKEAITLRPNEPVYHDERSEIAANLAAYHWQQNDSTKAGEYISEAIAESGTALRISPQNVNFWKTRTRALFLLATFSSDYLVETLQTIKVAQELAPTDVKIAYNVAVILGRLGKNQEAIFELEKAIELKPDYRDNYIALALFYEEVGNREKAKEVLNLVLIRINPEDQEVKEKLRELE